MKNGIKNGLETTTYSSDSQMNSPKKLFKAMFKDLFSSKELAWRLFVRDVSARYRQSIFGILWAFLPAIASGLVFIVLQSKKVVNFGEVDIPYPGICAGRNYPLANFCRQPELSVENSHGRKSDACES